MYGNWNYIWGFNLGDWLQLNESLLVLMCCCMKQDELKFFSSVLVKSEGLEESLCATEFCCPCGLLFDLLAQPVNSAALGTCDSGLMAVLCCPGLGTEPAEGQGRGCCLQGLSKHLRCCPACAAAAFWLAWILQTKNKTFKALLYPPCSPPAPFQENEQIKY